MQRFTEKDYKLFKSLAGLSQKSLKGTMSDFLKRKYPKVEIAKEWIMAEGDIPVAVVAHLDTVFKVPATDIFYDKEQGVMWSRQGLGADDRAGVFAILKIIQAGLRPTVIFTTDEELGCLGADAFIKAVPDAPEGLKYVIQLDRRGEVDCVFYDCDNKKFENYVESFGFITNFGSFSDISVICPCWGIAGVNLSVGYEGEHHETEILRTGPLMATIAKVKKMLQETSIPEFEYIPSKTSWWYNAGGSVKMYYGGPYESDWWRDDDTVYCAGCKKEFSEFETISARGADGKIVHFCPDCCTDHVQWCHKCGEPFVIEPGDTRKLCKDCEKENGKH